MGRLGLLNLESKKASGCIILNIRGLPVKVIISGAMLDHFIEIGKFVEIFGHESKELGCKPEIEIFIDFGFEKGLPAWSPVSVIAKNGFDSFQGIG